MSCWPISGVKSLEIHWVSLESRSRAVKKPQGGSHLKLDKFYSAKQKPTGFRKAVIMASDATSGNE